MSQGIIIIGADGLIGKGLQANLRTLGHDVRGTTRRANEADGKNQYFLDLGSPTTSPLPDADFVIFCAAMSKFADCRNFPELARQVNVTAPRAIANDVVRRGGRVLMLSSSIVFGCQAPGVVGESVPAPRCAYGRLKAEVESEILALGGGVLRLTKVLSPQAGILADWIGALRSGKTVRAFEDHRFSPIKLDDVLDAVATVVASESSGVFQVSGAADISYADAARHIAQRLGLPEGRVEGALAVENGIPEDEVTAYTSLDTTRLSCLNGYVPAAPREVIDQVFIDSFDGMRTK